jgi:hypothetical protein
MRASGKRYGTKSYEHTPHAVSLGPFGALRLEVLQSRDRGVETKVFLPIGSEARGSAASKKRIVSLATLGRIPGGPKGREELAKARSQGRQTEQGPGMDAARPCGL